MQRDRVMHENRISQLIGGYVSRQMLALWLLELALSFGLAYLLLSSGRPFGELPVVNHALILASTVGIMAFAIGLYRPEVFRRTRGMLINTALGALLAFPVAWAVIKAVGMDADRLVGYDALWPMKIVVAWIAAVFATRLLFLAAVRSNLFVRPVAILGTPGVMAATVAAVRISHRGFIDIVSGPAANAGPDNLRAQGVREAVLTPSDLAGLTGTERQGYAAKGIRIETETQFWERCLKRVNVANADEAWVAELDMKTVGPLAAALNRAGDVASSLLLLTLTLPLMLVIAVLVRLDSSGPILYRQERVGLAGRSFTLLKFRSMRSDAETRGPAWATQRDPRVTRIGSFIRRTRIDELPQLINVLRGEMSFIGPRPERPHFVKQLAEAIPHYRERARVKPGLTGWAQVSFPYGASVEDARVKLSYDLYYVKYRSPLLDLAILFATVRVILFQEGSR